MKLTNLLLILVLLLSISGPNGTLDAQPSVSGISPGALQPGKTLEVTLSGAKLDDPINIWTSFPAKIEIIPGEAGKKDLATRKCKITLDPATSVEIGGLVVGTSAGVSDVFVLPIDDMESVPDNGKNHSIAEAQVVTLPIGVDGNSDGSQADFYKFSAKAGQAVSIEVLGARIGSPFDAVLRVLDSNGRELLLVDDDPSFGADCRAQIKAPADGDYVIQLQDNKYGAGRYRLRIGDFPLVTSPYPLGARLGSMTKVAFTGSGAEGTPLFLKVPERVATGRVSVGVRTPSGKTSAMAVLATSSLPDFVEVESTADSTLPTPIILPCSVSGILQSARDQDTFQFAATKGQSMVFRAISRSLGSPCLLTMRILNSEGKQLAETPIGDADEFALTYAFPADGMYSIQVEDILRRGGYDYSYRVEILQNPGFSLSLKSDPKTLIKFLAPVKNGAFALEVQIARSGYDGPIRLSFEEPSVGFTIINPEVPAKAATHRILVTVPENAAVGTLLVPRLIGTAVASERSDSGVVSTYALLKTRFPNLNYPPNWFDGLLSIAVTPELPAFFNAKPAQPTIFLARGLAQSTFTFTLERPNAEFKDAITLMIDKLPAGVSVAVKPDKDQYVVTFSGAKDLPEGTHQARVIAYGEFKGQGQLTTTVIPLEIGSPLSVKAVPAGPIVAGQKQKVKLTLVRKGPDKQPVTLKWTKLPAGVTGDAQIMLTAEQSELEVELSAAADAAASNFTELTLEAATKFATQDLTVASVAATLEVKRP